MQKFSDFDFEGLHPALAGFLIDKKIDYKEIVATIVDLIQRGYLSFSHNTLGLEKFDDSLLFYEKEILERIFSFGESKRNFNLISALDYNSIIPFIKLDFVKLGLANYNENFKVELLVEGDFESEKTFFSRFKKIIVLFAVLFFVLFFFIMWALFPIFFPEFILLIVFLFSIFLFVFFLALFLLAIRDIIDSIVSNKNPTDLKLSKIRNQCLELSKFIQLNEYSDLNLSREFLPYTICFGHNKIWTKKFEQIKTRLNINLKLNYQVIDKVSIFHNSGYFELKNFKLIFKPVYIYKNNYDVQINIIHKNSKEESNVALIKQGTYSWVYELLFDRLISTFNFNGFKKIKNDFYFKGKKIIYDGWLLHNGANPLISLNLVNSKGMQLKIYGEFSDDELIVLLSIFYYYYFICSSPF